MAERRIWLLAVLDGRRLVGVIRYAIGAGSASRCARAPVWQGGPSESSWSTRPPQADATLQRRPPADYRLGSSPVAGEWRTPHLVSARPAAPTIHPRRGRSCVVT